MPRLEVREGIYTSIRMLISDELEVVPNRVAFEYAPKEAFIAYGMVHVCWRPETRSLFRGTFEVAGPPQCDGASDVDCRGCPALGCRCEVVPCERRGGDPPAELAEVEIRRSGRRCGIYADTKGGRAEGRLISAAGGCLPNTNVWNRETSVEGIGRGKGYFFERQVRSKASTSRDKGMTVSCSKSLPSRRLFLGSAAAFFFVGTTLTRARTLVGSLPWDAGTATPPVVVRPGPWWCAPPRTRPRWSKPRLIV